MRKMLLLCFFFITSFLFCLVLNAKEENLTKLKPSVSKLIPSFNKNIYNYNVFVDENEKKITFSYTCLNEDKNETYKLKNGHNDFRVKCNNLLYKINVVRGKNKNESGLKSLIVKGYEIDFKNDKYNYEIDLKKDEESLIFDFEAYNDEDTVTVTGNGNFNKNNNIVKIKVNGKKQVTYNIKVNKIESVFKEKSNVVSESSNLKQIIYIILLILSCVSILYLTFYLLFIRKKRTF